MSLKTSLSTGNFVQPRLKKEKEKAKVFFFFSGAIQAPHNCSNQFTSRKVLFAIVKPRMSTGVLSVPREFTGGRLNMTLPDHPRHLFFPT